MNIKSPFGRFFSTKSQLKTAVTLVMAGSIFSVSQAWGAATLLNGPAITETPEIFATEGPIWNLDVADQKITVVGKDLTIADTINGTQLCIDGSSVLGQDGSTCTGITASNFDRLVDSNAAGRDVAEDRCGPARSIYSTSEARSRDPVTQAQIEQNYFYMVQAAYNRYAPADLPADFLQRAGINRDTNGDGVGDTDVYPVSAGGTLKSAGHVYEDAAGNPYFITDVETVLELSENVTAGPIKAVDQGVAATLGGNGLCMDGWVPPSMIIGDLLLIFNQDPRFGSDVLGFGDVHIPLETFFSEISLGTTIDIIGHTVGEHVLFVQEALTELVAPGGDINISADRIRYRDDRGEIRIRGTVDRPDGVSLFAVLKNGAGNVVAEFGIPLVVNNVTGTAVFSGRQRDIANLGTVTELVLEARTSTGVTSATFPR